MNQIYYLAKISILNPEEATSILFSKVRSLVGSEMCIRDRYKHNFGFYPKP